MKKYTKCIENLRKYSMALAAVLCCATATTALTSCGDDDTADSGSGSSSSDSKVAGVTAKVAFGVTKDELNYCDVTVTYNDGISGEKTETLKDTLWVKEITANKLPATITAKKTVVLKKDVDVNNIKSFKFRTYSFYDYIKLNAAGKALNSYRLSWAISSPTTVGASKLKNLKEYIEEGKFNKEIKLNFDADGTDVSNSSTPTTTTSDIQVGWARRTHPIGEKSRSVKSNSSTTTTSDTQVGWARRTHPIGEKSRSVMSNSSTTTTSDTQVGMVRK